MSQKTLEEKLQTIVTLAGECLSELGTVHKRVPIAKVAETKSPTDIALQIVNKVGDCDESDAIQKQVLDKRDAEGKVLLSFFIANKYFGNAWLNSADIEKITSALGIKIDKRNGANYLKTLRKYLESAATPQRGQPTPYRLNRAGAKRFEEILHEKKS